MSDVYCPPPDSSDYLEQGIEYPIPVGKESLESTNPKQNDISYDEPKEDKNLRPLSGLQGDAERAKAVKLRSRIQSDTQNINTKSHLVLRAPIGGSVKSSSAIFPNQSNKLRKVGNEI